MRDPTGRYRLLVGLYGFLAALQVVAFAAGLSPYRPLSFLLLVAFLGLAVHCLILLRQQPDQTR